MEKTTNKKANGFDNLLPKKVALPKKKVAEDKEQTAVDKIHAPEVTAAPEKLVRITFDVTTSIHRQINLQLMKKDIKFINAYLLQLVTEDIERTKHIPIPQ